MMDPRIDVSRTVPYELLANAVELRLRSAPADGPPPRGFQFLLARHTGHDTEQDPDYLFASPFIPFEGAHDGRPDAAAYGAQFAHFYGRLFPRDAGAEAAADYLASLHIAEAGPPLELGVGTGRVAIPLAERVGEVVGVVPHRRCSRSSNAHRARSAACSATCAAIRATGATAWSTACSARCRSCSTPGSSRRCWRSAPRPPRQVPRW